MDEILHHLKNPGIMIHANEQRFRPSTLLSTIADGCGTYGDVWPPYVSKLSHKDVVEQGSILDSYFDSHPYIDTKRPLCDSNIMLWSPF